MATETGEVTDEIIERYRNSAKGEAGIVIPGYLYVHPLGRAFKKQSGIHSDDMIPGLRRLTEAAHNEGGLIIFQLAHAGRQTSKEVIGTTPLGPSSKGRDPVNFVKPREMTEEQIHEVILAFRAAALRAVESGADGIQIHAAHGYLINQFLSPYFNERKDSWGGSEENCFRLLKKIIVEIRNAVPKGMPILVKLNTNDYTCREGITPGLAAKYAEWLDGIGIDGLELSCGTALYSYMNMCRGEVPLKELVSVLPLWKRYLGKLMINKLVGKYPLEEGYNLEAAKMIKPAAMRTPIILVGGFRSVVRMEEIVQKGYADFISMSRPFLRDPFLVRKIREGKIEVVSCISCNRCLAAAAGNMPVRCYVKGFYK